MFKLFQPHAPHSLFFHILLTTDFGSIFIFSEHDYILRNTGEYFTDRSDEKI